MSSLAESKVTEIIKSLKSLEDDIDSLNTKVADMKKALTSKAQAEIEKLMEKTKEMANQEAEAIINSAKQKAEAESEKITQTGEEKLASLKAETESKFDEAVKHVVSRVLKA